MRLVIIESPFAGNVEENTKYARACMKDCLLRGEAPYASHLLYTQVGVLDDTVPEERKLGIEAGFAWGRAVDETGTETTRVIYTDRGISGGMKRGVEEAKLLGQKIEYRSLYECRWIIAWVGQCKAKTDPNSNYCEKHTKTCCMCKTSKATHGCSHTGQFVCGYPICDHDACKSAHARNHCR